jgi:serine/threonine protein kinase
MCAVVSRSQSQIAASIAALPVSAACKEWLGLALQKEPSARATAAQLLQHHWLVSCPVSEPEQQQIADVQQQQQVDCSQTSLLLQCCTSDDFPAASAANSLANGLTNHHAALPVAGCSFNGYNQQQQCKPQANSSWQAAAACSMQSSSSCAAAAGKLAPSNGNSSSCSNSGSGSISEMSQQQFASYLQTIGSWED